MQTVAYSHIEQTHSNISINLFIHSCFWSPDVNHELSLSSVLNNHHKQVFLLISRFCCWLCVFSTGLTSVQRAWTQKRLPITNPPEEGEPWPKAGRFPHKATNPANRWEINDRINHMNIYDVTANRFGFKMLKSEIVNSWFRRCCSKNNGIYLLYMIDWLTTLTVLLKISKSPWSNSCKQNLCIFFHHSNPFLYLFFTYWTAKVLSKYFPLLSYMLLPNTAYKWLNFLCKFECK